MSFFAQVEGTNCFTSTSISTDFPAVIGGTNGDTFMYSMDVSSSGIVIAGESIDAGIISAGGWKPLMLLYSSTATL